jgi:hypothetical protein
MRQDKGRPAFLPAFFLIALVAFTAFITLSCSNEAAPGPSDVPSVPPASTPATNTPVNSPSPSTSNKISSSLQIQINLRKAQIASPNPDRLSQMQAQGMDITHINSQRIFIYLIQQLTSDQTADLQSLGLTLYPESWIPPVGAHPAGYFLADMPIDKLDSLAARDYIVRLDTAETKVSTQQPSGLKGDIK